MVGENSSGSNRYDVLIIGGGPAGLSAAFFLASAGISCAVLEQRKEIGFPVQCAEAVSKRALDAAGLFDPLAIDSKVPGFRFFFPSMQYFTCRTEGFLINRLMFEQNLAARALERGAVIMTGTRVLSLSETKDGFIADTKKGIYTSAVLFGADGPRSLTDSVFFGNTSRLAHAVQLVLPPAPQADSTEPWLDMYLDPLGPFYFWMFRKKEGINAGGMTDSRDVMEGFLKKHGHDTTPPLARGFIRGLIPVSGIKKVLQKGRALLLGDAAGLTNPLTFAGIHSALISGRFAAEAAISYFKSGSQSLLNRYAAEMSSIYGCKAEAYLSQRCYSYTAAVLSFLGEYLDNRDVSVIDPLRFINKALKYPAVSGSVLPLLLHRNLLANRADELW